MSVWLFALPGLLFDPTGHLTFRTAQWFALYGVAIVAVLSLGNTLPRSVDARWFLPFLLFALDFGLHPGARPVLAAGAWAAFVLLLHLRAASPKFHRRATRAVLAAALASVGLLVLQAFDLDPLFRINPWVAGARIREYGTAAMTGMLGNAGDAGLCLAMALTLTPFAFSSAKWRWPVQGALFAGVLLTGARLPLLLASVFLVWQLPPRRRWIPPVLLLLAAVLYPPLHYKTIAAVSSGRTGIQASNRLSEWRVASQLALHQWPWQVRGAGSYGNAAAKERFQSSVPVTLRHGWFAQAHNDYLQTVVEYGWLGAALFLWVLWPWLRNLLKKGTPPGAFLMFACSMMFLFPVHLAPVVLVLALASPVSSDGSNDSHSVAIGGGRTYLLVGVLALASIAVVADWWVARQQSPVPAKLYAFFPEATPKKLVKQAASASTPSEATEALEALLNLEPNPWAALQWAQLRMREGNLDDAVQAVCRSYVATGHPALGEWLGDHSAHVANLSASDALFLPCVVSDETAD